MRILQLLILLAALAGCKPGDNAHVAAPVEAGPHLQIQMEMEKGAPDFSRVVVVRLTSGGKRVEVTSILPAVIAEAQVSGQPAKTIFRVNDAGTGLVMFSRDVPHNTSNRTEASFDELERNKGVVFPVVEADGSLKERKFVLEKIVIPR